MAITLTIPGRTEALPSAAARGGPPLAGGGTVTDLLVDVEVVHAFSLSPSARAEGAVQPRDVTVEDDDILDVEVDGFLLWMSAARYEESVRTFRPEASRDGKVVVDALPNPDVAVRGGGSPLASAVRVLRLAKTRIEDQLRDPATAKEFLNEFGLKL